MKQLMIIAVSTLLITGCSNSDITTVKDGRLDDFQEYTIGQALDNRDACLSTEWESFEDERGRTVVQYRCDLKDLANVATHNTQIKIDREEESLAAWEERFEGKIPRLEQELKEEMEKHAKAEQEAGHSLINIEIDRIEDSLKWARKEPEKMDALRAKIQEMKDEKEIQSKTTGFEYFQWTVLEDGQFMTIGGGIKKENPLRSEKEFYYTNLRKPFSVIYTKQSANYQEYIKYAGIALRSK